MTLHDPQHDSRHDPQRDLRRDLERLRGMKRTAEELLASGDPLLRGQYLHLLGRLDTLIDILATTVGEAE